MTTAEDVAWRHPEIAAAYPLPWQLGEFTLCNDGDTKRYAMDGIVCGGFGVSRIHTGEFVVVWLAVGAIAVVCSSKARAMEAVEALMKLGDWSRPEMPCDPRVALDICTARGGVIGVNRGEVEVAITPTPPI